MILEDAVKIRLSPYRETPQYYRTVDKVEDAKRWFEKTRVSVVSRDAGAIVLAMPASYARTRQGIGSLLLPDDAESPDHGTQLNRSGEMPGKGFFASASDLPERLDIQLGPGGRIVIPAVFRDAMQVNEGDRLMARMVDGELRVITPGMAVRRAQKMVRELIPADVDLVADLLEMRRKEVEDEFRDG